VTDQKEVLLRIDYDIKNDDSITNSDNDNTTKADVTAKIRIVRKKFNYKNQTFVLTGAIEVPVNLILPKNQGRPTRYFQIRDFTYWFVTLMVNGAPHTFRIAFRRDVILDDNHQQRQYENNKYECNIECESFIAPSQFVLCFDLLYKYYRHCFEHSANSPNIVPLMSNEETEKIQGLNNTQKEILKTIQLVKIYRDGDHHHLKDIVDEDDGNYPTPSPSSKDDNNTNSNIIKPTEDDVEMSENFTNAINEAQHNIEAAASITTIADNIEDALKAATVTPPMVKFIELLGIATLKNHYPHDEKNILSSAYGF
jgi:hypothetical protein